MKRLLLPVAVVATGLGFLAGCSEEATGPVAFQGTEMIIVAVKDSVDGVLAERIQRLDLSDSLGNFKTSYLLDSARLVSAPQAGKMAFLVEKAGDVFKIMVCDINGRNVVEVASSSSLERAISYPVLRRDGKRVVYSTHDSRLISANVDGSDPKLVANNAEYQGIPDYSPDGSRIAYYGNDGKLYVTNEDGGNQRVLAQLAQSDPEGRSKVEWSPDGKKVVYVGKDARGFVDIYSVNTDGDPNPVQLTNDGNGDTDPTWSPDGTRIAWASFPGDVYVMNADGSGRMNITANLGNLDFQPSWSPDGKRILFTDLYHNASAGYTAEVGTLRVYDFNTGESRSVAFSVYRGFWGKF